MVYLSGTSAVTPAALLDGSGDLWFNAGDTRDGPYFSVCSTVSASYGEIELKYGISLRHFKGDEITVRL